MYTLPAFDLGDKLMLTFMSRDEKVWTQSSGFLCILLEKSNVWECESLWRLLSTLSRGQVRCTLALVNTEVSCGEEGVERECVWEIERKRERERCWEGFWRAGPIPLVPGKRIFWWKFNSSYRGELWDLIRKSKISGQYLHTLPSYGNVKIFGFLTV